MNNAYRSLKDLFLCLIAGGLAVLVSALVLQPRFLETITLFQAGSILVLLILTAAALLRTSFGAHLISNNYVVREIGSVDLDVQINLAELTKILRIQLSGSRSKKGRERTPSSGSLTVSNVSLPFDWLRTVVRYLMTGKSDIFLESTLFVEDGDFRLRSSAHKAQELTLTVETSFTKQCDFSRAMATHALKLIEEIDPVPSIDTLSEMGAYQEALNLASELPSSFDKDIKLAGFYMDLHWTEDARLHLTVINSKRRNRARRHRRFELDMLGAYFFMETGALEAAENQLVSAEKNLPPVWRYKQRQASRRFLLLRRGNLFRARHDWSAALNAYAQCEMLLVKAFLTKLKMFAMPQSTNPNDLSGVELIEDELDVAGASELTANTFSALVHRALLSRRPELESLVHEWEDLMGEKVRCLALMGDIGDDFDVLSELYWRLGLLDTSFRTLFERALIEKDAALVSLRIEKFDEAVSHFEKAKSLFSNALEYASDEQYTLTPEPARMIDLAWCKFGIFHCARGIEQLSIRLDYPYDDTEDIDALREDCDTAFIAIENMLSGECEYAYACVLFAEWELSQTSDDNDYSGAISSLRDAMQINQFYVGRFRTDLDVSPLFADPEIKKLLAQRSD